ncbi:hypothetical protein OGU21_05930 [Klebsiella oxytoca]|uniref:hypothetical protein n=1 Tax=Klebsiella oxytoca TaxID=571 RepID=UPI0022B7B147|nr:hypothetical protein [Klebsiella oxytoca]EIY2866374.1 hypothetical protein [Klebsiella oxytoca]EKQ7193485.1 hypothetical protein [Klebsiella oxytoca]WBD84227.1 hypothetical protein OGU21_05930 [Klebsiella oxytoca]
MSDNNDSDKKLPAISPQDGEFIPASSEAGGGSDDYKRGLRDGISIGMNVGYEVAAERFQEIIPELIERGVMELPDIKKALSEGLRYGSPSCGKALVELYRYKKRVKYIK